MKILPIDFDNAVKQKWSKRTCPVSQMTFRLSGKYLYDTSGKHVVTTLWRVASSAMRNICDIFDDHFEHPGDETKPELQQLRASLPIDI